MPDPKKKQRKRGRGADPDETKRLLVEAARASLIEEGFGGTTARSISVRADCNQAAIYYHFGGIEPLLVEGLKKSSAERLARYEAALTGDMNLQQLVREIEVLYQEDRECGHLSVLTELAAGITSSPALRAGVEESTAPWLEYVEGRIVKVADSLSYKGFLPALDLADLVFSMVIGVELRNRIDGSHDRSDRLFKLATLVAGMVPTGN